MQDGAQDRIVNLLVVEDDVSFAELLSDDLRTFGHDVTVAGDGRSALALLDRHAFDAVILDWMLPEVDGISALRDLREHDMTVPVLMLSARGRAFDKVEGLETGADDYVVKPVSGAELNARLHALLRARNWRVDSSDTIRAGDIVVSPSTFRAWRDGAALDLGSLEFHLLSELVRNADMPVTRAMLLERVWHYDFEPSTNVVEAYIYRLRNRLTANGGSNPIKTIRGVGYMLKS
jgi:two-component system, OmpR family, response regulator